MNQFHNLTPSPCPLPRGEGGTPKFAAVTIRSGESPLPPCRGVRRSFRPCPVDMGAAERVRRGSAHPGREPGWGVHTNLEPPFTLPPAPSRQGRGDNIFGYSGFRVDQILSSLFPLPSGERVRERGATSSAGTAFHPRPCPLPQGRGGIRKPPNRNGNTSYPHDFLKSHVFETGT